MAFDRRSCKERFHDAIVGPVDITCWWSFRLVLSSSIVTDRLSFCSVSYIACWEGFRLVLSLSKLTWMTAFDLAVYLTLLGGGAFGNDMEWIIDAIWWAVPCLPTGVGSWYGMDHWRHLVSCLDAWYVTAGLGRARAGWSSCLFMWLCVSSVRCGTSSCSKPACLQLGQSARVRKLVDPQSNPLRLWLMPQRTETATIFQSSEDLSVHIFCNSPIFQARSVTIGRILFPIIFIRCIARHSCTCMAHVHTCMYVRVNVW